MQLPARRPRRRLGAAGFDRSWLAPIVGTLTGREGAVMPALREGGSSRVAVSSSSRVVTALSAVAPAHASGLQPRGEFRRGTGAGPATQRRTGATGPATEGHTGAAGGQRRGATSTAVEGLRWVFPVHYRDGATGLQPATRCDDRAVGGQAPGDRSSAPRRLAIRQLRWPGTGGVGERESLGPTYPDVLRQRFDLISFDPRGVGGSTPVRCAGHGAAGDRGPPASLIYAIGTFR